MCEQITSALRRPARNGVAALTLAATGLLLCGCHSTVLDPTGDVAVQQRNLILIATGLMLLIIVPVLVLTVVFAWRYRAGNAHAAYDPDFTHSTGLELVVWSCPLLIIVCLGAVTWTSTHLLDPYRPLGRIAPGQPVAPGTRPLQVQVVALDWKWLFIYPDQGIATINELTLPVNVPVRFSITSNDQMNTFFAPTMAGMVYAMPGMQTTLHAVLNKTGDSEGLSGNYTGAGFSEMRFKLHGVTEAGFDGWVRRVRSGLLRGPAEAAAPLTPATYLRLEKPSEKVPVSYFPSVTAGLFDRAVNRCIEPGRPCVADVMAEDAETDRGGVQGRGGRAMHMPAANAMHMPAANASTPTPQSKPTPALFKAPEDKGSGPNVSAPVRPSTPGQPATNN